MNDYNKVLLVLNETDKKLSVKSNSLLKISFETVDAELSKLCKIAANLYARKGILLAELKQFEYHTILENYCTTKSIQAKPEWQVMAEKNGWGPK